MRKFAGRGAALLSCLAILACTPAPASAPAALAPLASDAQIAAAEQAPLSPQAASMTAPFPPFQVLGAVYYVGTSDVTSYLIVTPDGHFLLDGGLPQTPPQILANIRALGFDIADVKYLLNSHAHFDHAGGLAALQRASGAVMVASAGDRATLEAGRIGYGPSANVPYPPIRVDRVIADGGTLTLGGVTLTAHLTPGHTQGCTSWSTETTAADGVRRRVLFHCSATVAGQSLAPESYPGMVPDFHATFARVGALRADVLLGAHAGFFDLQAKRERQIAGDANAFVDPAELQRFNRDLERRFAIELARQQTASTEQGHEAE